MYHAYNFSLDLSSLVELVLVFFTLCLDEAF